MELSFSAAMDIAAAAAASAAADILDPPFNPHTEAVSAAAATQTQEVESDQASHFAFHMPTLERWGSPAGFVCAQTGNTPAADVLDSDADTANEQVFYFVVEDVVKRWHHCWLASNETRVYHHSLAGCQLERCAALVSFQTVHHADNDPFAKLHREALQWGFAADWPALSTRLCYVAKFRYHSQRELWRAVTVPQIASLRHLYEDVAEDALAWRHDRSFDYYALCAALGSGFVADALCRVVSPEACKRITATIEQEPVGAYRCRVITSQQLAFCYHELTPRGTDRTNELFRLANACVDTFKLELVLPSAAAQQLSDYCWSMSNTVSDLARFWKPLERLFVRLRGEQYGFAAATERATIGAHAIAVHYADNDLLTNDTLRSLAYLAYLHALRLISINHVVANNNNTQQLQVMVPLHAETVGEVDGAAVLLLQKLANHVAPANGSATAECMLLLATTTQTIQVDAIERHYYYCSQSNSDTNDPNSLLALHRRTLAAFTADQLLNDSLTAQELHDHLLAACLARLPHIQASGQRPALVFYNAHRCDTALFRHAIYVLTSLLKSLCLRLDEMRCRALTGTDMPVQLVITSAGQCYSNPTLITVSNRQRLSYGNRGSQQQQQQVRWLGHFVSACVCRSLTMPSLSLPTQCVVYLAEQQCVAIVLPTCDMTTAEACCRTPPLIVFYTPGLVIDAVTNACTSHHTSELYTLAWHLVHQLALAPAEVFGGDQLQHLYVATLDSNGAPLASTIRTHKRPTVLYTHSRMLSTQPGQSHRLMSLVDATEHALFVCYTGVNTARLVDWIRNSGNAGNTSELVPLLLDR
jgi:hypothetical protein